MGRFIVCFSDYGITKMNSYFSEKDGRDIATTNQIVFEKLFYDEVLNKTFISAATDSFSLFEIIIHEVL